MAVEGGFPVSTSSKVDEDIISNTIAPAPSPTNLGGPVFVSPTSPASSARADSLSGAPASERSSAAREFAVKASQAEGTGAKNVGTGELVSETARLDFAKVTAPQLVLERKGGTAKGEGIVSRKR